MLRSMIDHRKVLVLALNGPAVGGGAAWFPGVADIVLAADSSWLQVPFSALGLVPEFGSATSFYHSLGAHRTNDFLMFGRKLTVQELEQWGLVNRIFPTQGFQSKVVEFLEEQLSINDGKSMMEAKRLQNLPLRRDRMLAVYDAAEALAERFVEDAPKQRFADKNKLLLGGFEARNILEMMLTKKQISLSLSQSCKEGKSRFYRGVVAIRSGRVKLFQTLEETGSLLRDHSFRRNRSCFVKFHDFRSSMYDFLSASTLHAHHCQICSPSVRARNTILCHPLFQGHPGDSVYRFDPLQVRPDLYDNVSFWH